MVSRVFGLSILISVLALIVAFIYGGLHALILTAVLGVFEVSLSFDNAVVNATVLQRMNAYWQRMFLTVGILIAVFGMRLIFPLAIVWITAGLDPVQAIHIALNPPADGAPRFPDGSPSYETALADAHPQIAAFGGMFLMMLFLNFIFSEREITWLSCLERPLGRAGKLDQLAVVVALAALVVSVEFLVEDTVVPTVLFAGMLGLGSYILIDGLGTMFESHQEQTGAAGPSQLGQTAGKAAFFLFLYLEVLDASFSFDGVIGAFAITSDPIIIALGLGFIGAMFVRSITIFLVRKGVLADYVYLEHGAHWAIGALAVILFISLGIHVNEILTGLIGVVLIAAAFISSVVRNRTANKDDSDRLPPVLMN